MRIREKLLTSTCFAGGAVVLRLQRLLILAFGQVAPHVPKFTWPADQLSLVGIRPDCRFLLRTSGRALSLVLHGDQAAAIFGPNVELLNSPLFGFCRVRRIDESDKRRRGPVEPADFPGALFLTLTHSPNIGLFRPLVISI